MKLLVFAHRLDLGGTEVDAIKMAAELRDQHGFDIVFHAAEGPALDMIRDRGLPFVPAPDTPYHPAPQRMAALRQLVQRERPALIHAWDWFQGLEAYYGAYLRLRVPLLISDMNIRLTRAMPRNVPTTFASPALTAAAERAGWIAPTTLLPPVDTRTNAPQLVSGLGFRTRHGIKDSDVLIVAVSRMADLMASEHLVRAIEVMRTLGQNMPLKLLIVGDGAARADLQARTDAANRHLYREAVILTGAMPDARDAYAAADIVLGMGGSALRGLAFGKPLVVVGSGGFASPFTPATAPGFLQTGLQGSGTPKTGNTALSDALRPLAQRPQLRAQLGPFGRDYVLEHHDLERIATRLAGMCETAARQPSRRRQDMIDAARTAFFYLRERRFRMARRDAIPGR